MKKIDLGKTISILAYVGMIAGLIFVAVEIGRNNEMLAAQNRAERADFRQRPSEQLLNNPRIAQALYKGRRGEALSDDERSVLYTYYNYAITSWEYLWMEYDAGLLTIEELGIDGRKRLFGSWPGISERWPLMSDLYHPDFVRWMEENILD